MNLLNGVRVLEVSFLAPDALGGHLADLGAEVIKVEASPDGSRIRWPGAPIWRVLHWRWNRGKKSVFLDLKDSEERQLFLELAKEADVVIDGMRAGAMKRLGLGYDDVKAVNPGIVYCSLSGLGQDGPYRDLPTHGWAFDAFAGLAKPVIVEDGTPRLPSERASLVGIQAGPLYAGLGVLAALLHQRASGEGTYLDVAQLDAAIVWRASIVDAIANDVVPPPTGERLRYQYYETHDGEYVLLMAMENKFWHNFCAAVERQDLENHPGASPATASSEQIEELRGALTAIFKGRTRAEWVKVFIEHDVAGSPVYLGQDILEDEHVAAHGLVVDQPQADGSSLRLLGSPIRVPGTTFAPRRAPEAGEHTDQILTPLRTPPAPAVNGDIENEH